MALGSGQPVSTFWSGREMKERDEAADTLVGMWKLEEADTVDADDRVLGPAFGGKPSGYIVYRPDGMMITVITDANQPKLSGDRLAAPVEERAAAFSAASAYAGGYRFNGRQVTHMVEVASYPNWVGTEIIRNVELVGDKAIYRTEPQILDGVSVILRFVWARHRPENG